MVEDETAMPTAQEGVSFGAAIILAIAVFAFAIPYMSYKVSQQQAAISADIQNEVFAVLSAMEVDRAMVELDLDMVIVRANPLAQKLFGLEQGGTIDRIVPPEFMATHQASKDRYKRTKPVEVIHTINCEVILADGTRRPVRIRIAATSTRWIALIIFKGGIDETNLQPNAH